MPILAASSMQTDLFSRIWKDLGHAFARKGNEINRIKRGHQMQLGIVIPSTFPFIVVPLHRHSFIRSKEAVMYRCNAILH